MQVRLLGPVDVVVDGVARQVPGLRRRSILAVLGLAAGDVVSADRLADVVWGDHPPATSHNALQRHVSYLRDVIGDRAAVAARPPGYALNLGADGTDVTLATRLIGRARQSPDPALRVSYLRQALVLWRGRPLLDVADHAFLDAHAGRLAALEREAILNLAEGRMALGEHTGLIPTLELLTGEQPFDEGLHRLLMLALYRSGRQADSLSVYRRLQEALDQQLGVEPGSAVRELEQAILRQDPGLQSVASPVVAGTRRGPVPRQLPADITGFVGRNLELTELDGLAAASGTALAVISGLGGVGKTTLAVHWAHRHASRFPDGQLYVNLRGLGATGTPLDPGEAAAGLLEAFGVPAQCVPVGLEPQSGLLRSTLAGKRVLLVLDNAHDAEQVRPLLPGSAGCMTIVTSRGQLTPLVATHGARLLRLGILADWETRALLAARLDSVWMSQHPELVERVVRRCAGLPLALAVAAARITSQADTPGHLMEEPSDTTDAFQFLDGGDASTNLRAVFTWSYQALSPAAARLFRLLGTHPGPHVSLRGAASLAAVPAAEAERLFGELAGMNLVTDGGHARYVVHDLVHAFARDREETDPSLADPIVPLRRLVEHYLQTAHAAARLINPYLDAVVVPTPRPEVVPAVLTTAEQALSWFGHELPVMVGLAGQARAAGLDQPAWQLAWLCTDFLERGGHWTQWMALHEGGIAAAKRMEDPAAQAHLSGGLGQARMWQLRFADATAHFKQALDLFVRLDDARGQCRVEHNLSRLSMMRRRHRDALDHGQRALALARVVGDRATIAKELNTVGWCWAALGDFTQALRDCEAALTLGRQIGDPILESAVLDSLGFVHHGLGDDARAIHLYQQAVSHLRQSGDRYHEAEVLTHLAQAQLTNGEQRDAVDTLRLVLAILTDLAHPEAELIGRWLEDVAG